MSLLKSYRLSCEGTDLHLRREFVETGQYEAGRGDRRTLRDGCVRMTSEVWSAKDARAEGARRRWIRHPETLPIYRGSSDTTEIRYDLCPNCASALIAPDQTSQEIQGEREPLA